MPSTTRTYIECWDCSWAGKVREKGNYKESTCFVPHREDNQRAGGCGTLCRSPEKC